MKFFPIGEIGISTRARNCLYNAQIYYVGNLENLTEQAISRVPGLGRKTVEEILKVCEEWGIELLDKKMEKVAAEYQRLKDIEKNNMQFVRGETRGIEFLEA
jgi:DNA-directed RNA polymerase alpha subunit